MKLLLVEDHTLFRSGIKLLLEHNSPGMIVTESDCLTNALSALEQDSFDLVLLDLKLSDCAGLDALNYIRKGSPDIPVVVLSGEQDSLVIHKAIERGAMGFITKSSTSEEMMAAIDLTISGGVYLPKEIAHQQLSSGTISQVRSDTATLASLSDRQREVLKYLVKGAPNKHISSEMKISQNTVKAHLTAIFRILGASNRTEAVYFAARAGVTLD